MSDLISFREVEADDAKLILDWRTTHRINKVMITDVDYDIENQKRWISDSYSKDSYYHWLILFDNKPIGLIYLSDYIESENTTSWGYYIGCVDFIGHGGVIPPYFFNWAFSVLGVRSIRAEILLHNTSVIKLHQHYGFVFTPTKDRVIKKFANEVLQVSMSLDINRWDFNLYIKCSSPFPTSKWKSFRM